MKAAVLGGQEASFSLANGARIPSTADEVWAEMRNPALRAAVDFK